MMRDQSGIRGYLLAPEYVGEQISEMRAEDFSSCLKKVMAWWWSLRRPW